MKRKWTLFAATILAVGAVTLFAADTGIYAKQSPEEEAKSTVTKYLDAVTSGDVEQILKYVEDKRYDDDARQKEEYSKMVTNSPVSKAEILSIQQVNESEMEATIKFVEKNNKNYEISLPVQKENGQWKVIVTSKSPVEQN
jgi:hypothetical protein